MGRFIALRALKAAPTVSLCIAAIAGFWPGMTPMPSAAGAAPFDEVPGQTFVVTTTTDGTGAGTLRTAITSANANPGLDTITFAIAGSGVQTLPITSALPVITDPVIIDGTTQTGYAGTPLIRFTPGAGGVTGLINITGGGSTVKALSFAFFSGITTNNGMIVLASGNNTVAACHSGTGSGGTQVYITGPNNTVGGASLADRNYFYGNTSSRENVIISGAGATGNRIIGNVFGTTPAGVRQTNAGKNILIDGAANNTVGGPNSTTPGGACTGECNLISGSDNDGIAISGAAATGNTVIGNFVGLAADGLAVNRNSNYGVHLINAPNNTIGGDTPSERNFIAANSFGSVFVEGTGGNNVITGNYVGLNATGAAAITGSFNVPAFGVQLNSNGNRVGGTAAGERNVITGSNRGLIINGASNLVQGNYIGTNAAGDSALTTQFDGVLITGANNTIGGVTGTTLGGACTGACNVISGNGRNTLNHGLVITGTGATGNVVDGNYIGLNAAGTAAIRNGFPGTGVAILLFNASGNTIGRSSAQPAGLTAALKKLRGETDWFCVQDDVTKSFVYFNRVTGSYISRNCLTGENSSSPPPGQTRYDLLEGYRWFLVPGKVAVVIDAFSDEGWARQVPATTLPTLPWGNEISDSDTTDNGFCVCPPFGFQYLVGNIDITGDAAGSNNNLVASTISGSTSDTRTDLGENADVGVKILNGSYNAVSDFYSRVRSQSNLEIGLTNYVEDVHLSQDSGVKPITTGRTNSPSMFAWNMPDGNVKMTGSFSAGENEPWEIALQKVETRGSQNRQTPIGPTLPVNTGPTGTIQIDWNIVGDDAKQVQTANSIVSYAVKVEPLPAGHGDTTEFSQPFRVPRRRFDFTVDARTDISIYRPGLTANAPSNWYILNSEGNGFRSVQFGIGEDKAVPLDYNGDLNSDFAVFRPSTGSWFWSRFSGDPSSNFETKQWGQSGDVPVPGDYDGDGFGDAAVFRPGPTVGTWYIDQSALGIRSLQFGLATDKPVPADYNGDGQTDIGVYRNGAWYINTCAECPLTSYQFGLANDVPVQADYDGDGKADIAVWRPSTGTWYIQQSMAGFMAIQWGKMGDTPVNGDFDGDDRNDVGVWRPTDGIWYILQSQSGFRAVQWGQNGDQPATRFSFD